MIPRNHAVTAAASLITLISCSPENLDKYSFQTTPIGSTSSYIPAASSLPGSQNQSHHELSGATPSVAGLKDNSDIDAALIKEGLAMTSPFYCNPLRYTAYQLNSIRSCEPFLKYYFSTGQPFGGPPGGKVDPYPPPPIGGAMGYPQIGHDDDDYPTAEEIERQEERLRAPIRRDQNYLKAFVGSAAGRLERQILESEGRY
jgi:hypothetical protein